MTSFTRVAASIQRDVAAGLKAFTDVHGGEPSLAAFDAELTCAASAAADADALPPTLSLTPLHLDGRPARQTLAAAAARWSHTLTDALAGRVAARLADVDAWTATAATTLADGAADADVGALLAEARPKVVARRTPSVMGTPAGSRRPTGESGGAARRSRVAAPAGATLRRQSLVDAAGPASQKPSGTTATGSRRPTGEAAGSRRPTGEAGASSSRWPTTETSAPRATTDARRSTGDRALPPPPPPDPVKMQAAASATAALYAATASSRDVADRAAAVDATLSDAAAAAALLARVGAPLPVTTEAAVGAASAKLRGLVKMAVARREELAPKRAAEAARLKAAASDLGARVRAFLARVAEAKLGEAPVSQVQPHHAAAALSAVEGLLLGGGENDCTPYLADLEAAAADLRGKQAMMDVFEFDVAPLVAVKVSGMDGGREGRGASDQNQPPSLVPPDSPTSPTSKPCGPPPPPCSPPWPSGMPPPGPPPTRAPSPTARAAWPKRWRARHAARGRSPRTRRWTAASKRWRHCCPWWTTCATRPCGTGTGTSWGR